MRSRALIEATLELRVRRRRELAPPTAGCFDPTSSLRLDERLLSRLDRSFALEFATVCDGSASASRARKLTAGKLTPKLTDRTADARGRQWPTQQRHSLP